jgi:hypothetical protein
MNNDLIHEFVLNDWSQNIIFITAVVLLIEYVNNVFIEKFIICNDKIQFIFEEILRVEIDAIVVLSEMKRLKKCINWWWFDDVHVDKLMNNVNNLLHET